MKIMMKKKVNDNNVPPGEAYDLLKIPPSFFSGDDIFTTIPSLSVKPVNSFTVVFPYSSFWTEPSGCSWLNFSKSYTSSVGGTLLLFKSSFSSLFSFSITLLSIFSSSAIGENSFSGDLS